MIYNLDNNLKLLIGLILFIILPSNVRGGIHQKRLLEHLFKNYDSLERPVQNENESLNVSINLSVQQIVDVDEKKQTIIFSGWLDMVIYDDFILKNQ
jgi:nicotinic acetylcholine receptor alpha-10